MFIGVEIYPSSFKKRRKALVPLAWACTVASATPRSEILVICALTWKEVIFTGSVS